METKEFKLYRVEESKDELEKGIENIKKVNEQQELLIKIIKSSPDADKLKEFVEELEKTVTKTSEQIATLSDRHVMLIDIINKARENSEIDDLLYKFIVALGIDALK